MSHDVVVIGAGLAGLACAAALQRGGVDVTVLDAADAVGGRVRTDEVDGYRCDRGFQVLLTAYPELHRQLDVAALDLQPFEPGALVWLDGRGHVVGDPFRRPGRALATLLAPIGSPADKARIVRLRHQLRSVHASHLLRRRDVTTLEALREFGFSERITERFFRPLVGGIQLDPALQTSRRAFDIVFRMLADGEATVPAMGMAALPEQLAARLAAGTVQLGRSVEGVVRAGATWAVRTADGATVTTPRVVVATDGPTAARLIGLPATAGKSAAAVWFAADRAPTGERLVVLDGSGRGPVLNAAVMSNVAPSYAPPGRHLVVAAIPGSPGGDLVAAARQQLRRWWGGEVDRWGVVATHRIEFAQPEQRPPLRPKQPVALGDGLYVCGDHRDTASIQGALFSGRRCAAAVLA
jgi:phytoene dehydrogenase-like protein